MTSVEEDLDVLKLAYQSHTQGLCGNQIVFERGIIQSRRSDATGRHQPPLILIF